MSTEKEIIWLHDTTGSYQYGIVPHADTSRAQVMYQAGDQFVTKLSERDSKNAAEHGEGGVRFFTFATPYRGHPGFQDLDDINPENYEEVMQSLEYDGGTYIMPAWRAMLAAWEEEFGHADPQPDAVVLVDTDGALDTDTSHGPSDEQRFEAALRDLPPHFSVVLCLVGQGRDNASALQTYRRIEANSNGRLKVKSLQGQTDPGEIAQAMLDMVNS